MRSSPVPGATVHHVADLAAKAKLPLQRASRIIKGPVAEHAPADADAMDVSSSSLSLERSGGARDCACTACEDVPAAEDQLVREPEPIHVGEGRASYSFPGGGTRVFVQFGVAEALRREMGRNVRGAHLYGASCGAITATFLATGVCFSQAIELACKLANEKGLYGRRLGLIGSWGAILHDWLDQLLPADAHRLCHGRVHIALEHVWAGQEIVSQYPTREDLVHAVLTSVHIPCVLDWMPLRRYKGRLYMDGFIKGKVPVKDSSTVVLEYPEGALQTPSVALLGMHEALDHMRWGLEHGMAARPWHTGSSGGHTLHSNDEID